jgi:hypothetical protein
VDRAGMVRGAATERLTGLLAGVVMSFLLPSASSLRKAGRISCGPLFHLLQ